MQPLAEHELERIPDPGWINTAHLCECGHRTIVVQPANLPYWSVCSQCKSITRGLLINKAGVMHDMT